MMELAAYADIIKKRAAAPDSGSDVPLVQPGDTTTPALLRLLLNVATDAAEVHKRSFWASRVLRRNSPREWDSFAAIEDHDRDMLPHGDRAIEFFTVSQCTSGSHASLRSTKHASVLLAEGWYPMPDAVTRDPQTMVSRVAPCVMVRHKTVQNAFETVLGRCDSATNMCSQCAALEGENMHFNQTMKNPSKTKYILFFGVLHDNEKRKRPLANGSKHIN